MALNYGKINLALGGEDEECEVAEEGPSISSHSLTRMQDKIVPRASITSDIGVLATSFTPKAMHQLNSPFAREAQDTFLSKRNEFMSTNLQFGFEDDPEMPISAFQEEQEDY